MIAVITLTNECLSNSTLKNTISLSQNCLENARNISTMKSFKYEPNPTRNINMKNFQIDWAMEILLAKKTTSNETKINEAVFNPITDKENISVAIPDKTKTTKALLNPLNATKKIFNINNKFGVIFAGKSNVKKEL